jgi:TolC family type I secretion outer membrane protein
LAVPPHARAQTLTLAEALDSALAQHPSMLAAQARVDGARATVAAARSQLVPTLSGAAGLTRFEKPMVVAPLHGFDPRNPPAFDQTLVQGQLALQYTLFDGGGRSARIRGAGATEQEAVAGRDATRMDLLERVTGAYLSVLTAGEVLDAAEGHVAALEAEQHRAQQNLDQGTAARVDVLRASASLMDARAQDATARASDELARRSLARLMGVDPAALEHRTLADVSFTRAPAATDSVESPQVVEARRAVEAAGARVDQELAGRMPSLQAGAGLHEYGSGVGNYVTEWQAGLQVSWPVFTGGARSAAIRQARAAFRSAQQGLRLAELQDESAVDEAHAAVVEADARAQALDASVKQWEEVARIEALGLKEGSGVQTDLLNAQAGLFQARAGYARARYDEMLARVRLARAQGSLDRRWIDEALEVR